MKHILGRAALCLAVTLSGMPSNAASAAGLQKNQTYGYGNSQVLTLTYTQNFACVEQPNDDLNFNGIKAKSDPRETQTPICQAGIDPTINPPGVPGKAIATTDPLFVLIPMFSADNDKNPDDAISCTGVVAGTICGSTLGNTLIQIFGTLPEAFKTTPLVYTQCPDHHLPAGTCTMHASQVDLAPVLAKLGLIPNPPTSNVFVPTPNHSHLLLSSQINQSQEWWIVVPVLVLKQSDWPNQAGTTGITSVSKLRAAEKANEAIEAPSNFFLYFGSQANASAPMSGMDMGR